MMLTAGDSGTSHRDPSEGVVLSDLFYNTDKAIGTIASRVQSPGRQSSLAFLASPRKTSASATAAPARHYDTDAWPTMSLYKTVLVRPAHASPLSPSCHAALALRVSAL